MKKALSLILVFVLCFGLCACGGTSSKKTYADVERELIGTWEVKTDASFISQESDTEDLYTKAWLDFMSNGSVEVQAQLIHQDVGTVASKYYEGTYTVEDGKIILNYTKAGDIIDSVIKSKEYSGSDTLQYTFQNGTLSISLNGDKLEKDQ